MNGLVMAGWGECESFGLEQAELQEKESTLD
jgi:hypothetical protein